MKQLNSTSIIELSQSALENNIKFIKSKIGKKVKLSSVVKGNAYGHGIEEIVPIIESCGVDHFSVFSSDEARRVKSVVSDSTDIMIMGFIADEDDDCVIKNNIEFYVYDLIRAKKALELSKKHNKKAIIHIDIETGMNRTGFDFEQLQIFVKFLKKNPDNFHIKELCTHYAGAESIANHVRVKKQIKVYKKTYTWLINQNINPEIRHTACSAAAVTYPETRMDMVRIGIMQYGFWPSMETFIHYIHNKKNKTDPIIRVLRWKSQVMAIKNIKQGEFIGYGNNYLAHRNLKIAIVPVGYNNGFSRNLSNQGKVLINNQRISILGMVNMNMIVADVAKLYDIKIGDEVVIIGKQGKHQLSVASFSELTKQVNYELLTRLPLDINRIKTKQLWLLLN